MTRLCRHQGSIAADTIVLECIHSIAWKQGTIHRGHSKSPTSPPHRIRFPIPSFRCKCDAAHPPRPIHGGSCCLVRTTRGRQVVSWKHVRGSDTSCPCHLTFLPGTLQRLTHLFSHIFILFFTAKILRGWKLLVVLTLLLGNDVSGRRFKLPSVRWPTNSGDK